MNMNSQEKLTYKTIKIQELQNRPQVIGEFADNKKLSQHMNMKYNWVGRPSLHYKDSGISPLRIICKNGLFRANGFFQAFLTAYQQHGDIVLVPDQIWIMICFYLSTYIDSNANILRSKLVKHEGVKTLKVVEIVGTKQESIEQQKKWDNFFQQIQQLIKKQTVEGVFEGMTCNFSTTNKTYKTISTVMIMNSMKKVFNYERIVCACGINNVHMAGVKQDWIKIIEKLKYLIQFDVDGELKKYIEHVQVILQNFLLTFEENPDVEWWNSIMKSYEKQRIYGGEQTEVDGWILHFFGIYDKTKIDSFPDMTIKVPVKLLNTLTNQEKDIMIVSDWSSISKLNKRSYKPDVGMSVVDITGLKMIKF